MAQSLRVQCDVRKRSVLSGLSTTPCGSKQPKADLGETNLGVAWERFQNMRLNKISGGLTRSLQKGAPHMSATSGPRNSRTQSHNDATVSELIGWTLVLIAVLLGLFITDGPGANVRDSWFVSSFVNQIEMAVRIPAHFRSKAMTGKVETDTPNGDHHA